MITITGGRRTGKTTDAIRTAIIKGSVIICRNFDAKQEIVSRMKKLTKDDPCLAVGVYTIGEVMNGKIRGQRIDNIVVDDGDLIFEQMLNNYIGFKNGPHDEKSCIQYLSPTFTLENFRAEE